ncbi:MAG: hypothetical protein K0R72_710 [Clostridia bacterium]|jgi:hypothetical protein|nr:hypothetical protein [Clostridia bacterium]
MYSTNIELKHIDNLSDTEIKYDLQNLDTSNLILEYLLESTDKKLKCKLENRMKLFDLNTYIEYMKFINIHRIHHIYNNIEFEIDEFHTTILPEFPINSLPETIRKFVDEVATSTQTSHDMGATCVLAVLSICLQKKFQVNVTSDWVEPLNLFLTFIAPPGERKSGVIKYFIMPVIKFELNENEKLKPKLEQNKIEKSILEKEKIVLEDKFSKGKETDHGKISDLSDKISQFNELKPIKLFVDSVTPEKLSNLMYENDGKIAIISAEGGIFDIMSGMYSKNINIDVFLKGHAGDLIKVDRLNREAEYILDPALTILLAIQPNVLNKILKNYEFCGRGLLARFLFSIPTSKVGKRSFNSEKINTITQENYNELIDKLLNLNPPIIKNIQFSDEALNLMEIFHNDLEPKLINELYKLADWSKKLEGVIARIAGILELTTNTDPLVISKKSVANAINIGNYFLEHAKHVFIDNNTSPDIKDAIYILDYIKNNRVFNISTRELLRKRRKFNNIEEMLGGLRELEKRKYIFYNTNSKEFLVNPNIY